MARVVLAMSGGVDSSVSAQLLVEQGYDVVGVFLRTGAEALEPVACATDSAGAALAKKSRGCCSAVDAGDARRVADRLDIPFYALDFEREFDRIKDYFVEEYLAARTPNPCVACNTWLKFGKLWEFAAAAEADFIATGHYARIAHLPDGPRLQRAADEAKDQTYFLFGLPQERLARILFPVGHLRKQEVRALAAAQDLGVQNKPDSQEVCFVPDGNHARLVRERRPELAGVGGAIVDETGREVGRHDGIARFTIGQRRGLGVAVGAPRYVVKLDAATQEVVIGPEMLLKRGSLRAERVSWLLPQRPAGPIRCQVKIRHMHQPAAAVATPVGDAADVVFDQPQSAVTPGQAAVFYDGDIVLGGGWIA